ncbi:MAG: hypothetical protein CBB68_02715 [Rhodospirillaceae bacterium TMED8]|nr:glutathione S-transferase [Magnetovibrio sp.]OUT52287.1 MAG: hypothetical protein CBB68_02715 [Rhodospirillaceae bacterium TMED8]|tara:strand:- start:1006 stop:1626 length:621 start_codon:yes stop_codon:yes gene_type:complete
MVHVLGRANSINVQKVVWCITEIGIPFKRSDVGMEFGGNETPEYLQKNPTGLIPTLEDGDFTVWESNTIVRYVSEKFGKGDWLLSSPAERAQASQWMDWYVTAMHAPMTVIFRNLIRTLGSNRDMAEVHAATRTAVKYWTMLDNHLSDKKFVCGDLISIGDIPVGCSVYRWYTMELERPNLPHLYAWFDRLQEREAYRTHVMTPLT